MRDQFNLLKLFYTPTRCNMCIDFSAEHADIAVGDPWLKGRDGKLMFTDNRTTVLVRTDIGEEMVAGAQEAGYISAQDLPLSTFMVNFESGARYKRNFVPKTIMLRKLIGMPVPKYHRPIGTGKARDYLPVLVKNMVLLMSNAKSFRRFALLLAQTAPAISYFAWNRRKKEKKFSAAYSKYEAFAERISTKQSQVAKPNSQGKARV